MCWWGGERRTGRRGCRGKLMHLGWLDGRKTQREAASLNMMLKPVCLGIKKWEHVMIVWYMWVTLGSMFSVLFIWPGRWLAALCGKNFFPKCFHTCHTYKQHWLQPFYATVSDRDLGWGSQGQHKVKPAEIVQTFGMVYVRGRIAKMAKCGLFDEMWIVWAFAPDIFFFLIKQFVKFSLENH